MIEMFLGGGKLLGAGVSAYGQYKSAYENAALMDLQSQYLDMQATDLIEQGKNAEADVIEQGRQLRESQKSGFAGQNVDVSSGTAMVIQDQTRDLAQKEADRQQLDYMRQAWGKSTDATMTRKQAAVTRKTGRFQAASTLLSGALGGAGTMAGV